MTLATDRLILRPFEESDFAAVHEYACNPEVVRYTSFGPNTEEETRGFIQRAIAQTQAEERRGYDFAVVVRSENRLIGGAGLYLSADESRIAELGYVFHKAYWGQGYATEAAGALIRFGFEQIGLHRIFARCDPANVGSARVMEKNGLTREGLLREAGWIKGGWRSCLQYSILAHEWQPETAFRKEEHLL